MNEAATQEAATGAAREAQEPPLWCRWCGKQVVLADGAAVHAATRSRSGALDGHPASPVDQEPPLWKAAREIEADYKGVFTLTARFGFLRADWAASRCTGTPGHFEASTEQDMRRQLAAATGSASRERAPL
jgi:hypothetical protein